MEIGITQYLYIILLKTLGEYFKVGCWGNQTIKKEGEKKKKTFFVNSLGLIL